MADANRADGIMPKAAKAGCQSVDRLVR